MPTDYDDGDTAERYLNTYSRPVRSRIEGFTFLNRIGDVTGLDVLDVACGEGHYTRMLKRAGAASVAGFDISAKMIGLARAEEAREPLGIDYSVADARTPVAQQDFDIAVAAYLLVYARDRAELARMCRAVASRVRPGGRFVTLTTNPALYSFAPLPDYGKYGFRIRLAEQVSEGAPIELIVPDGGRGLVIENYYLPIEAYDAALHEAGFRDVAVHAPEVSPPPDGVDEGDFWDDYLAAPPAIVIDCVRS